MIVEVDFSFRYSLITLLVALCVLASSENMADSQHPNLSREQYLDTLNVRVDVLGINPCDSINLS